MFVKHFADFLWQISFFPSPAGRDSLTWQTMVLLVGPLIYNQRNQNVNARILSHATTTIIRSSEMQLVMARASDGISGPHDRLIRCIASFWYCLINRVVCALMQESTVRVWIVDCSCRLFVNKLHTNSFLRWFTIARRFPWSPVREAAFFS